MDTGTTPESSRKIQQIGGNQAFNSFKILSCKVFLNILNAPFISFFVKEKWIKLGTEAQNMHDLVQDHHGVIVVGSSAYFQMAKVEINLSRNRSLISRM